jgi:hypothetical protein
MPDNPDDVVILKLPADQLRRKGLDPQQRWYLRRDGVVEKGLLDVMRILLSRGFDEKDVDEMDDHEFHEKEQRDLELELEVLGTLGQMFEHKLGKLQDGSKEVAGVREEIKRMCDIYRQGESRCFNHINRYLLAL